MADTNINAPDRKSDPNAGFFAIDRRVWRRVIEDGIVSAVTYLVAARGTGGDNLTTAWSTDAVERKTGCSRPKAKAAFEQFERRGICDLLRPGTKPLRKLRPAAHVPGCAPYSIQLTAAEAQFFARLPLEVSDVNSTEAEEERVWELMALDSLTPAQQIEYDKLTEPTYTFSLEERKLADSLVSKGHAKWDPIQFGRRQNLLPRLQNDADDPDWIWLPNSIVDGADGEIAPIELLRQAQDVALLRVFVECYHAQSLVWHGGLDSTHVRIDYDRLHLGTYAEHEIWGFRQANWLIPPPFGYPLAIEGSLWSDEEWHGTFPESYIAVFRLSQLGLLELVPTLFEGASAEAEPIHPLPEIASTVGLTNAERTVGMAAKRAAEAMLTKIGRVPPEGYLIAPVPRNISNVQVRGVLRLRYRPHTNATAQWLAKSSRWEQIAVRFDTICEKITGTKLQHQR